jgi:hypothetical protein
VWLFIFFAYLLTFSTRTEELSVPALDVEVGSPVNDYECRFVVPQASEFRLDSAAQQSHAPSVASKVGCVPRGLFCSLLTPLSQEPDQIVVPPGAEGPAADLAGRLLSLGAVPAAVAVLLLVGQRAHARRLVEAPGAPLELVDEFSALSLSWSGEEAVE